MSLLFVVSLLCIKCIISETVIGDEIWFDDFQFDGFGENGWHIYNGNKYETNYMSFSPQNKITFGENNMSYHGPLNNLGFFGIWFKRNFSCLHSANIYIAFDFISCQNTSYLGLDATDIVSIYKLNSLQHIAIKKNLSQQTGALLDVFNDDIYAKNTNIYHCNSYNKWEYKSFNFSFVGNATSKQKWNLNLKGDVTSNSKYISMYNIKVQCITNPNSTNKSTVYPTIGPTNIPTIYPSMEAVTNPTVNPTKYPIIISSLYPTIYTTTIYLKNEPSESYTILYGVVIQIMFEYEDDSNTTEIVKIIPIILIDIIDEQLIDCNINTFNDYEIEQLNRNGSIVVVNATIFVCDETAQQTLITSDHPKQLQLIFINRLNNYYNTTNLRVSSDDITLNIQDIEYVNPVSIHTSTTMVIRSVFRSAINHNINIRYITYITLGGIMCIAFIIVIIDMVYTRQFYNKYRIHNTLFFALTACNLITDSIIAYELWMYYINRSMDDDLFMFIISIVAASSVVISFVYNNIFGVLTIYIIPSHLCCLFSYILVIISGDSYVTLKLLSSNLFGINSIHSVDHFKIRKIRIITLLIQNIPQIAVQSLFIAMILQSVDILMIISIILSFITLIPHVPYIVFCMQCKQMIQRQYILKMGIDVKVPANMNNTSNMDLLSKQLSDILGIKPFQIQIISITGSKIKVIHEVTKKEKYGNSNTYIWRLYMNKMDKINTAIKTIYALNSKIETGLILDINKNKDNPSPISILSESELTDIPQTRFSMVPSGTNETNAESKNNNKYNLSIPIFGIHELTASDDKKKDDIITDDDEEMYKIGTIPLRKISDPGTPTPTTPITPIPTSPVSPVSPGVDNDNYDDNNNMDNDNEKDIVLDSIGYDIIKEDQPLELSPSPPPICDNNDNEDIKEGDNTKSDDVNDLKGDDNIYQKTDSDENKDDHIDTKYEYLIHKGMEPHLSADSTSNEDPEYITTDTEMDIYQIEEPTETTLTQTISTDPFQHSIPNLLSND